MKKNIVFTTLILSVGLFNKESPAITTPALTEVTPPQSDDIYLPVAENLWKNNNFQTYTLSYINNSIKESVPLATTNVNISQSFDDISPENF